MSVTNIMISATCSQRYSALLNWPAHVNFGDIKGMETIVFKYLGDAHPEGWDYDKYSKGWDCQKQILNDEKWDTHSKGWDCDQHILKDETVIQTSRGWALRHTFWRMRPARQIFWMMRPWDTQFKRLDCQTHILNDEKWDTHSKGWDCDKLILKDETVRHTRTSRGWTLRHAF